jgi:hypothetical protein
VLFFLAFTCGLLIIVLLETLGAILLFLSGHDATLLVFGLSITKKTVSPCCSETNYGRPDRLVGLAW